MRTVTKWTNSDLRTLRRLYPTGGVEAVFVALDGRHSRGSIKTTAWNWGIRCKTPHWDLRRAKA